MISLDQVYLLEQKVESAVEKIQQLQAENDALRKKCSELTNALSSKTEQLSTFENDQTQIENGIRKALDRLNSIENTVLKTVGQAAATPVAPVQTAPQVQSVTIPAPQQETPVQSNPQNEQPVQEIQPKAIPSFDTMKPFEQENSETEESEVYSEGTPDNMFAPFDSMPDSDVQDEDENSDGLGFDIF